MISNESSSKNNVYILLLLMLGLAVFGLYKLLVDEESVVTGSHSIEEASNADKSSFQGVSERPQDDHPNSKATRDSNSESIAFEGVRSIDPAPNPKSYILPQYEYENVSVDSDVSYSQARLDNLAKAVKYHQRTLLSPEDQPFVEGFAEDQARAQEAVKIHQELNSVDSQLSAPTSPARQERLISAVNLHQDSQKPDWEQLPQDNEASHVARQRVLNEAVGLHQSTATEPGKRQANVGYGSQQPDAIERQSAINDAVELHQRTSVDPVTD